MVISGNTTPIAPVRNASGGDSLAVLALKSALETQKASIQTIAETIKPAPEAGSGGLDITV